MPRIQVTQPDIIIKLFLFFNSKKSGQMINSTFKQNSAKEVLPNSPAQHAGLVAHSDYIVGYDHGIDFFDLVSESVGKPINLFVYNSDTIKCRDVVVVPSETWGNS
ncbi:Golgi reassembly-stacking protein 2-like, partial [Octopus sinensis]|uniref:Golgi reassembly-stacking protein 2-like n=1 Tax=Octopus sinensis TaxID=2607531 RepID=A0A7E6EJ49_9MOLL